MNLALSNPNPAATNAIDFQPTAVIQIKDNDSGSSGESLVTNTGDSGPGSLRQAILNADAASSPSDILFDIPAATDPLLSIPVSGFDPSTQTWTITLQSPLPAITQTVSIDGYYQQNPAFRSATLPRSRRPCRRSGSPAFSPAGHSR